MELIQYVKALDVVQVEVGQEEIHRLVIPDVATGLVDAVACVQDNIVFLGVD